MEAAKGADDPVVPRYVVLLFFCTYCLGERRAEAASSPEYTSMLQTNRHFRMALRWMH